MIAIHGDSEERDGERAGLKMYVCIGQACASQETIGVLIEVVFEVVGRRVSDVGGVIIEVVV